MLKALELIGFKSFADKTRFEFPPGITTVVGPNGSGKSNVVDAIKWVLGEQSVKSLRGKEMADVIFNGSSSRPPLNAAEVTLTFDNTRHILPIDTTEVHITRRVYRSGEGEYLINRQPSRLRDIREMFFGTGVGSEAYGVIEQGKVDSMLQASPRDRRMIFEEAAGISRFKAKKVESLRRLERVDQNLLRLTDIVSEVESRLRSVRLQASKARRYKEHTDRLQSLRTHVALVDWRALGARLDAAQLEIDSLAEARDGASAEAESLEAQVLRLDTELSEQADAVRQREARSSHLRERITADESTISHESQRTVECEAELQRHRQQLSALDLRAGNLRHELQETWQALSTAEREHREVAAQLAVDERRLEESIAQLDALRQQESYCRSSHVEAMRSSAALVREVSVLEAAIETAQASLARNALRLNELEAARRSIAAEHEQLQARQDALHAAVEQQRSELIAAHAQLSELRSQLAQRTQELADGRQRHAVASERASLLAELESRFEGLTAGVKEVLLKAREAADGPFRHVHGLVADLLRAPVTIAPLIDIALADCAQHVVVGPNDELLSLLVERPYPFPGRVGFVSVGDDPLAADGVHAPDHVDLSDEAGVVGRADRFVETPAEFASLARRLLGRTWIVERLSHALNLSRGAGRGLNFVTHTGEWLAADGTLVVGPRQSATGLISRRSELRALKTLIDELEVAIARNLAVREHLAEQLKLAESRHAELTNQHSAAQQAASEHRARVDTAASRLKQLDEQRQAVETENAAAAAQAAAAAASRAASLLRREEADNQVAAAEEQLTSLATRLGEVIAARDESERHATAAKVELAKTEARLHALRAREQQFERDQQERRQAIDDSRWQLVQCQQRLAAAQMAILQAESRVAELYLHKESLAAEIAALVASRDARRDQRGQLAAAGQKSRAAARKLDEQQHERQLQAQELRLERASLAERMREDYAIDLIALEAAPATGDERQRAEIEQEIGELRRKIQHLGNVNLDALDEIDELERRFTALSAQHADLTKAKQVLEQIIQKINGDSRRLFAETLEVVKVNFQALFRKLFGGGQADVVLEEGVDILESGIEIIARPPGKELRSISLMSGGEKTLTCVALLLAIFQYRPSPFCVLDEVDAALDEANIERFVGVLREFLAWTQFIVITHSKKTMTCASTLYGVTMQESGVSKRVAVRFEDVHEDGRIMERKSAEAADETEAAQRGMQVAPLRAVYARVAFWFNRG